MLWMQPSNTPMHAATCPQHQLFVLGGNLEPEGASHYMLVIAKFMDISNCLCNPYTT